MTAHEDMEIRETVRLGRTVQAPAQARMGLEGLRPHLSAGVFDDLRLLVSELVTNSVLHGGPDPASWVELSYEVADERVRVEVVDPGPGFAPPVEHVPEDDDVSGRGLFMVRTVANRWGVDGHGITRVWFEIDLSEPFARSGAGV